METASLLTLAGEARAIGAEIERAFGSLPADVLHAQPAPGAWSAAQCLEHLIRSNTSYVPAFEAILRGDYRPSVAARLPLLPRLWGRLIFHVVRPESVRKARTPARFDPRPDAVGRDILPAFAATQAQLIALMTRLGEVDAARTVIVSPFASAVAYSVLDACRIIVAHEKRHLGQALKAVKAVEEMRDEPTIAVKQ